jgi:hypothetical protein
MATKEELEKAIEDWKAAAEWGAEGHKDACLRTVKALEIERDTGVAVCSCCFVPFAEHDPRRFNG